MKMYKINWIFKIFLVVFNISNVWSDCGMTSDDVDKCGHSASFFGNRDVFVPTNEAELDKHCSDTKANMGCIKDYISDCTTGFVKQTSELGLNNAFKHLQRRCDAPKDRQEFLEHVKCFTDKANMEAFHICADKNLVMMERIMMGGEDDIVGAGCCIFHSFQNCIRKNNMQICGEATTDYWDEVINEIAEDSISFSCNGFETMEKCEKSLNPKAFNEIKSVEAITDADTLAAKHKHQSAMTLMMDFMKKISKER